MFVGSCVLAIYIVLLISLTVLMDIKDTLKQIKRDLHDK